MFVCVEGALQYMNFSFFHYFMLYLARNRLSMIKCLYWYLIIYYYNYFTICDADLTLNQYWASILCFLGYTSYYSFIYIYLYQSGGRIQMYGLGVFQSTYNVFLVILVEQRLLNPKPLDATLSPLSIFVMGKIPKGANVNHKNRFLAITLSKIDIGN